MIPHSCIRCFHRGSFTYSVIPGISYRFIFKYDIMCFSCIHPYHSRNLHTDIRLFHTRFIGWTEPVDGPICIYKHPCPQTMTMGDSMDMHTYRQWLLFLFLQYPFYVPTVESADFGKTEKDRDDSDFSGIHPSLPLRRIPYDKTSKCLSMDIYGCGYVFVVALAPYRP